MESHKFHVKKAIVDLLSEPYTSLAGIVVDLFCSSKTSLVFLPMCSSPLALPFSASCFISQFTLTRLEENSRLWILIQSFQVTLSLYLQVLRPSFAFNKDGGYSSFLKHATKFKETKGIIINTFAELESRAVNQLKSDSETPSIYTVGPLPELEGQKQRPDRERIMKWLDDQPPLSVVFLCFGSLASFEPDQLAQIAIALKQSRYRFLWSVRSPVPKDFTYGTGEYSNFFKILPEGFLESVENRGLVCGWGPQIEVLAHEAVGGFVSHCGWNSTVQSLWRGVPVATWLLYAEQQINASELVRELELAMELRLDYQMQNAKNLVMAEEIEKAIRCLI